MRAKVERVHVPVPRSEEVEPVPDERRGLDRRADPAVPEQPAVVAIEHPDVSVHAVDDKVVAHHGGRGCQLPVRDVEAPAERAVSHRQLPDAPPGVTDVRHTVGDDGGVLEQAAERPAPDHAKRRPEVDRRLRLRPRVVCSVERPLE